MPTFACFTSPGRLTAAQKGEIARVCTDVYHEEFGLARYLIQVIFCEIAEGDRYVAGRPAQPDLVWIRCDLREGRSAAQKSELLHRIRQGVALSSNVSEEAVWLYLCDLPPTNLMVWGHIMPALVEGIPKDDNWFESLSEPLQARLRPLG
jgi:phenylpyruvate tautomerase PptA (4-oxalocrotonate tautomerase family)